MSAEKTLIGTSPPVSVRASSSNDTLFSPSVLAALHTNRPSSLGSSADHRPQEPATTPFQYWWTISSTNTYTYPWIGILHGWRAADFCTSSSASPITIRGHHPRSGCKHCQSEKSRRTSILQLKNHSQFKPGDRAMTPSPHFPTKMAIQMQKRFLGVITTCFYSYVLEFRVMLWLNSTLHKSSNWSRRKGKLFNNQL